jgi:hypothetical protein
MFIARPLLVTWAVSNLTIGPHADCRLLTAES